VRDQYNSPREAEPLRKFLAGDPDVSYHENWMTMVREATAEGRLFSRVRVVSLPLSDYARFNMWVSGYTRAAGDDIRYLARDRAEAAGLPEHDFWLFDSAKLVRMHFDDSDRFTRAEVIEDPASIVEHNYWRDAARHHALSPDEFVRQHEQRDVQRRGSA
jgi:hypothetical protein